MTDRVFVSNLCLFGHHGVMPEETRLGQRFFLDIDCRVDLEEAVRDDDYGKAVCYGRLCDVAAEVSDSGPFRLIETLAERIAVAILARFDRVAEVRVEVRKPSAPIAARLDHAGVEITRRRSAAFALSLGSNIGDKARNIREAIAGLAGDAAITIGAISHFYQTAPWGKLDQDWFLNLCAIGTTSLSPHDLLRRCKALEAQIGRTPAVRWGPRVIDIDLLTCGDRVLATPDLTLPHPELFNRAFVLVPLAEIAGGLVVGGRSIAEAVAGLPDAGADVVRLDAPASP